MKDQWRRAFHRLCRVCTACGRNFLESAVRADVKRSHSGEEAVKVPRVRGMEQQGWLRTQDSWLYLSIWKAVKG